MSVHRLNERASEGQVRDGPGRCHSWNFMRGNPPQYIPLDKGDQQIDMQVAELLNFARDACNIPETYWMNDSKEGEEAKKAENIFSCHGNTRSSLLLKVVRALYSKPRCSFVLPMFEQDDVYCFPNGAAFCSEKKPTAFMAASALAQNVNCKMRPTTRAKAELYTNKGFALADSVADRGNATTPGGKPQILPPASSSSSAPVAKRPAAAPTQTKKQKSSKDLGEMD